jgi:hypothetical protein
MNMQTQEQQGRREPDAYLVNGAPVSQEEFAQFIRDFAKSRQTTH